jgi:hypothetical protein
VIVNGYLQLDPQEWVRTVEKRRATLGRYRQGFSVCHRFAHACTSCRLHTPGRGHPWRAERGSPCPRRSGGHVAWSRRGVQQSQRDGRSFRETVPLNHAPSRQDQDLTGTSDTPVVVIMRTDLCLCEGLLSHAWKQHASDAARNRLISQPDCGDGERARRRLRGAEGADREPRRVRPPPFPGVRIRAVVGGSRGWRTVCLRGRRRSST